MSESEDFKLYQQNGNHVKSTSSCFFGRISLFFKDYYFAHVNEHMWERSNKKLYLIFWTQLKYLGNNLSDCKMMNNNENQLPMGGCRSPVYGASTTFHCVLGNLRYFNFNIHTRESVVWKNLKYFFFVFVNQFAWTRVWCFFFSFLIWLLASVFNSSNFLFYESIQKTLLAWKGIKVEWRLKFIHKSN